MEAEFKDKEERRKMALKRFEANKQANKDRVAGPSVGKQLKFGATIAKPAASDCGPSGG